MLIFARIMENRALLFDFDGVVADTEGEYSRFWDKRAAHDPAPRLRPSPQRPADQRLPGKRQTV